MSQQSEILSGFVANSVNVALVIEESRSLRDRMSRDPWNLADKIVREDNAGLRGNFTIFAQ